jgi:putative sigma-54 modulation protein
MQTNITFRHLDATEALKAFAREKVERVHKYIDSAREAHVVLALERHFHVAEITIHAGPFLLQGKDKSTDMYQSIDLAMAKIERQLKRYKEKLKDHRALPHHAENGLLLGLRHDVVSLEQPEAKSSALHKIIRTEEISAKPMSVEEAVMQMDLIENDFLVFKNAASQEINVVFRRKDGNYGLIEARSR